MPSQYGDPKKRPPPIMIPPLPFSRLVPNLNPVQMNHNDQCQQLQQYSVQNPSSVTQRGSWPREGAPLTLPSESDALHLPSSQRHVSKQISNYESTVTSQSSRSRFKQSKHGNPSAASIPDQLEVAEETTNRGQIEARNEQKWFKATGQVPPTPLIGTINNDDVLVRTEDLRAQCRVMQRDRQPEQEETSKSPRKTLFGNIRNAFNRTPNNAPPLMPSKAAQILGAAPRALHKIEVRPIKTPDSLVTPVGLERSDTSKSLPDKVGTPRNDTRHDRRSTSRRHRIERKLPNRGNDLYANAENTRPVPAMDAAKSASPPTPPAKDTPRVRRPAMIPSSPLRRAHGSEYLRESYGVSLGSGVKLQFPEFALSPSLAHTESPAKSDTSFPKHQQYTEEEYAKAIKGGLLQRPSPELSGPNDQQEGDHCISQEAPIPEMSQLSFPERKSDELHHDDYHTRSLNSLLLDSEIDDVFFHAPSGKDLDRLRESSSGKGSIEMVFQGDANDIDPNSSTGKLISSSNQDKVLPQVLNDTGLTQATQEHHNGKKHEFRSPKIDGQGQGTLEKSSSRLTDMLNGVSPRKSNFKSDFVPNCPSAVPSPLHKTEPSFVQLHPTHTSPRSLGRWGQPQMSKSIEEHFFMTNEHLDVVGKTTWDLLEMFKEQHLTTFETKKDQLVELIEKHVEEIKSRITKLDEKIDHTSEKHSNLHEDVEKILSFMKRDVTNALAAQEKKTMDMETHVKELQNVVQALQQSLEQKFPDVKAAGFPTTNLPHPNFPLPIHRSQPSLASYPSNTHEYGQENQPPMPPLHENRGAPLTQENQHDQRMGQNNGYGHQWSARPGYSGRNSREDRSPYQGHSPYNFGGPFNNGYAAGYSPYHFSPHPSDQHHS